jgi:hypothetical protein
MFNWTDNILQNIPHIESQCENIMQNIVSPADNVMALNNVMVCINNYT